MGHNSRSPSGRVEDKGTRNRLTDTYRFLDAVMELVAYLASVANVVTSTFSEDLGLSEQVGV